MSSPKPNFVDVNNQVGRKSIIWQYLWQDKESEKYVLITFGVHLITIAQLHPFSNFFVHILGNATTLYFHSEIS